MVYWVIVVVVVVSICKSIPYFVNGIVIDKLSVSVRNPYHIPGMLVAKHYLFHYVLIYSKVKSQEFTF